MNAATPNAARARRQRRVLASLACAVLCAALPPTSAGADAVALRQRFAALSAPARPGAPALAPLAPLEQPLYLQSRESPDRLEGEVYARIDHPFENLRHALAAGNHWCEILILHPNVKYCRATRESSDEVLHVGIGRKTFQPLDDVHWVRFEFRAQGANGELLSAELRAPTGPLGTHDYRLSIEAAALGPSTSVLHLTYGYAFGTMGRLAMQSYLATVGRDKVGFSVVGQRSDGQPVYVGGTRGVVERNAMRYFIAIGARLAADARGNPRPHHASLLLWFDGTERYPRQLHELERAEYLDMKVRELWRQQTVTYRPPKG